MNKIITKKRLKNIALMLISNILSALVYNLFILPLGLVTGGTTGISTIINYIYRVDPAVILYILSFIFILLSFMYLGKEESVASIASSLLFPTLVKLTQPVTNLIYIDYSDVLVISLIAGVLYGISNGLMYKSGYNNSGIPTVGRILNKYYKIPISTSTNIMNITIVIISCAFFGWENIMYIIIILYINGIIIDKILLGISSNKAFYIITNQAEQIKEYVIDKLNHSVTVFDVKGGLEEHRKKVILTVIPTREYYRFTEGIKAIDKDAFFLATDAYEVVGGK